MCTTTQPASLYHNSPSSAKPEKVRKPMLLVDQTGNVSFRTKLVHDLSQAIHFARCISKNSRFLDPEVVQSERTKRPAWFVTYLPSNPERRADMLTRLQAERIERCIAEHDGYFWHRCSGYSLCLSGSGSEYRVTPTSCTCPDFQETCSKVNLLCKHIISYQIKFGGRDDNKTATTATD